MTPSQKRYAFNLIALRDELLDMYDAASNNRK